MDSDGYIEELIPIWIDSGINVCDPIEVAALNDIVHYREKFGTKMAYTGGIDKRCIAAGGDIELAPGEYAWPTQSNWQLSDKYGWRRCPFHGKEFHNGLDIVLTSGTKGSPVYAIADGYITLPTGEVLTYTDTATIRATAYTHTDAGCDFVTATGTTVHWGTVAVDPRYIPYGTRMFIVSNDGEYVYGIAVAEDCGGDIKGDRMDLYMPTYQQCMEFGRRNCTLYFLGR